MKGELRFVVRLHPHPVGLNRRLIGPRRIQRIRRTGHLRHRTIIVRLRDFHLPRRRQTLHDQPLLPVQVLPGQQQRRLGLIQHWFGDHVRVHPEGTGEIIACRLAGRLAELQRTSGAKVLVLAQYYPVVWDDKAFAAEQRRMTEGLLACMRRQGLATLDSFDALAQGAAPRTLYKKWHMNEAGNRLIAGLVARALEADGK